MLFNIFRAKTSTPKPSLDYLSGPPPDKLVQSFLIALPVIEKALTTNVSSDVASTCINHLTSLHPLLQLASNPEQTSQKHHSNANALIRFLHWARSTNEKDNDKSDSVTQKELSEYYIKLQAIEAIIDRIISDYSLDTPDSFQDTTLLPDYSYKHMCVNTKDDPFIVYGVDSLRYSNEKMDLTGFPQQPCGFDLQSMGRPRHYKTCNFDPSHSGSHHHLDNVFNHRSMIKKRKHIYSKKILIKKHNGVFIMNIKRERKTKPY